MSPNLNTSEIVAQTSGRSLRRMRRSTSNASGLRFSATPKYFRDPVNKGAWVFHECQMIFRLTIFANAHKLKLAGYSQKAPRDNSPSVADEELLGRQLCVALAVVSECNEELTLNLCDVSGELT